MKSKIILFLAGLLLLPLFCHGYEINGINYQMLTSNTVQVTGPSSSFYQRNLVIPESVEINGTTCTVVSIGEWAFYQNKYLTSVTIPNTVTSIGEFAFGSCANLVSVELSNSLQSIGQYSFNSTNIVSMTIPNSVTSIGVGIFSGCQELTSVTFSNSIDYISDYTFFRCTGLKTITIPPHITSIGNYAFFECTCLSSVLIPTSVTWIGSNTFKGCSMLTSVSIPNSVKYIGDSAFQNCIGLTTATISNTLTYLGDNSFSNCNQLKEVYYETIDPITANISAFDNQCYNQATLYVAVGGIDKAKTTEPWKNFFDIQEIGLSTGIHNVILDTNIDAPMEIYNLHGIRVGYSLDGLAHGMYLIRQSGKTIKIVI